MARYILIDNPSGYIFGDTAVYAPDQPGDLTVIEAARLLDQRVVGDFFRTYSERTRSALNEPGYHVWRADVDGSEAVPLVEDGQNPDTIAAVEKHCRYWAFVATASVED